MPAKLPVDTTPPDTIAPRVWRNRILGLGEEAPDQLLANPRNWRIHPAHQQDAVTVTLEQVGWVQSVIVNKRTGFVVDGHLRVALALRREEPVVPVVYVDLNDDEEGLILAALDTTAKMAATDTDLLDALLRDIDGFAGANQLLQMIREGEGLAILPPPTLDELEQTHGAPDPMLFWPVLRFQVPPEVHAQFVGALNAQPGDTELAKLQAMLSYFEGKSDSDAVGVNDG